VRDDSSCKLFTPLSMLDQTAEDVGDVDFEKKEFSALIKQVCLLLPCSVLFRVLWVC